MRAPNTLAVDPTNVEQARAWDGHEGDYWAEHADWFDRSLAGYDAAFAEAARIGRGHQVLDVGCGTGQTTRAAARAAIDGSALGVDLSAHMIDVARQRAARDGLPNARFLHADAQRHAFPPGGFDGVISRTGAMFFGDPTAAFGNLARALRPCGRLTLLTWQPAARNEWFGAFWTALTGRAELASPPPGAPGPFSLSDPERVHELLSTTGFTDIEVVGRTADLRYGDPADTERLLLGLLGWMLRDRDDPERGRAALRASLTDHLSSDGGVRYGSAAWLVTARRT